MPRPIEALIHTAALAHNLARARAAAPDARVWAVVKANAYGHGIERAFEGLRGADGFALLDLAEAERLRALGWRGPILLLEGCFEPRDLELCSRLNCGTWCTASRADRLAGRAQDAAAAPRVPEDEQRHEPAGLQAGGLPRRLGTRLNAALPQVDEMSLMTHFSDADGPRGVAHQVAAFDAATHDLPGERSVSNSAADPAPRPEPTTGCAAGILSYGSAPDFPDHDIAPLGPAADDDAALEAHRHAAAGRRRHRGLWQQLHGAGAAAAIGIVACGYADGYPRHCPTGTPVLVEGVRTRTVGRCRWT